MKINEAIRNDLQNSVLCWLATVDDDGTPSVTPKEIFSGHGDEHIVIADIASSHSVHNAIARPKVCVSFVDVFRQKGFKLTGNARIVAADDSDFQALGADLLRMAGTDFPIRNIIAVKVESVSRIWAPSYKLFPERSENDRMWSAYETYGVRPV
ncbi:pyridoxamine 5'-phosphate oxidase family protein [Agrobacterium sp. B1(2019)]|uniref:pyridoxamine 5'-phosphate oxidase family protein n=1 Tax=Agrobacterium sp. B1(2019) TaxID=2607032 RepID=UPI0011EDCCD0|nr:pyridoxamine 5'-phosphate oxidase family protein [Agrobacterium sp. B1(2019)]TZG37702.1 pyridoxamine 5'-phosphate oxidase family protein [Agrobacterium sp. B1(2019)]